MLHAIPGALALLLSAQSVALEGATVHTMLPGEDARVVTVLLEGERVVAVGEALEAPPGARRVDLTGKHLVPALVDGYVHFDPAHDLLYTVMGVGLVRDVGGSDHARLALERDPERRARALGPDLLTAGAVLDGDPPSSANAAILRDPAAAEVLLQVLFDEEVDFLTTSLGLLPEVRRRVIELAGGAGLEVWGPRPRDADLAASVAEGQAGFHSLDALLPPDLDWGLAQPPAFRRGTDALVAAKRPLVPLFFASALRLDNQEKREDTPGLLSLLSPTYSMWWSTELDQRSAGMTAEALEIGRRVLKKQANLMLALHAAGVRLIAGSGAPQPWIFPGRGLHEELELWQDLGIPAADALRAATRDAAEAFGVAGKHGSIEAGAVASLLVLERDPTVDIRALRSIDQLIVRGALLEHQRIEDLVATVAAEAERTREAINREVTVEPPPIPPGGVLVLEGVVDSIGYGLRLWRESYRAVRMPDGKLVLLGRVHYTGGSDGGLREMLVSQVLQEGLLVGAEVLLTADQGTLRFEGSWTAESWRMRRSFGNQSMGVTTTRDRPALIDTGSVTSLLVLGQSAPRDRFPIVTLHEGLEPEAAMWRLELDDEGNHQVRTHLGRIAFRLDEVGALEKALTVIGGQSTGLVPVSRDAHGGAGLPLPEDKRALIEERREAEDVER